MDGVRLAVLSNRFDAVVGGMMNTLFRSGRSGVLNSARDFSCCVLTAGHELVMGAESLPIHVMSGPDLMARRIVELHPELRRGDAFLHNSPYHGNSHAADHCDPRAGRSTTRACTASPSLAKAHQADCGNSLPTTYMAAARDVYEEGALIFARAASRRDYADNDDIMRMCGCASACPTSGGATTSRCSARCASASGACSSSAAEVGWDASGDLRHGLVRLQRAAAWSTRSRACRPAASSRSAGTTRSRVRPTASRSGP